MGYLIKNKKTGWILHETWNPFETIKEAKIWIKKHSYELDKIHNYKIIKEK